MQPTAREKTGAPYVKLFERHYTSYVELDRIERQGTIQLCPRNKTGHDRLENRTVQSPHDALKKRESDHDPGRRSVQECRCQVASRTTTLLRPDMPVGFGIFVARSIKPGQIGSRRRKMTANKIQINRVPVLTLWAAVVAESFWDERCRQ